MEGKRPQYPSGPHIQLGAFWRESSEVEDFRKLLSWLLSRDYQLHNLVVIKTLDGRLPRFRQKDIDLSNEELTIAEPTVEAARGSATSLPFAAQLWSPAEHNVPVDLGYAVMSEESYRAGEKHVIEIVASGADQDIIVNVAEDRVHSETVKGAERLDRWQHNTFRDLCDELQPVYAALRVEQALQPPASLLASSTVAEYADMYLSDALGLSVIDRLNLTRNPACSVVRFRNGTFVPFRWGFCENIKESLAAMAVIRQRIGTYFVAP